jgi:hypothetical protein
MTLRDTLQAEINDLQAKITEKQNQLSAFENNASAFLSQEANDVKQFVLSAWTHLFGSSPAPSDLETPSK